MLKSLYIPLSEYQESLLAYHEEHQRMLHDRILQNANIMVLVLSFVFLFEITFIGGAFPDSMGKIDALRYVGSVSVLFWANLVLVSSCSILLTAINSMSSPWPETEDYFPDALSCTQQASMAIRYGIMKSSDKCMKLAQESTKAARWGIFAGVSLGIVSVGAFMFNGGMFDSVAGRLAAALDGILPDISFDDAVVMLVWLGLDVVAIIASILFYERSTRSLRDYRRVDNADGAPAEPEGSGSGSEHIVQVAREYQRQFWERYEIAAEERVNPLKDGTAWISLGPECNLNCAHCYNKKSDGTFYGAKMELHLLEELLVALRGCGVASVTLTGGDPSMYAELPAAVSLVKGHGMACQFPTNGVMYADKVKAREIAASQVDSVTVSLKGGGEGSGDAADEHAAFEQAVQGIKNLSELDVRVVASYTIGDDNLPYVERAVQEAMAAGAVAVTLSPKFETESSFQGDSAPMLSPSAAGAVVGWVERHFDSLSEICNGQLFLEQTLPLCMWSQGFIEGLDKHGQVRTVCQLFEGGSIVIGSQGELLFCNALYSYPAGTFGEEFDDAVSLRDHLLSEGVRKARASLTSPPSERCQGCMLYPRCAAGCATRWMVHSFEDFEPYLKQWDYKSVSLS